MRIGRTKALKSVAVAAILAIALTATGRVSAELVPAATDFLNHARWTVRDGLKQQTVTDVVEARDGYLWLTTYGGLARFDGVQFQTFELDNTPQLGTNKLVSLFEDNQHRLWIGTFEYGVVLRDGGEFRRFSSGAPGEDVQDFVQDPSGTLWAAGRGISRLIEDETGSAFVPVSTPAWIADTHVPDLLIRSDGQLWAASERGILRYREGVFEVVSDSAFARYTRAMVVDGQDRLWLVSGLGIGYLEDGEIQVVRAHDERAYSAALDDRGRVLAGVSSGLYRLDTFDGEVRIEQISLPQDDDSLQSGVTALHRDRAGDIWAGTNTFGLIRISDVPFTQFEDPRGLPHGSVSMLATDPRGGMWLQGDAGWISHWDNDRVTAMTGRDGWPSDGRPQLVGVTSGGAVWLRTADMLIRVHGSAEDGFDTDRYPHRVGQGLVEDADGRLWFGSEGALLEFAEGVFQRHTIAELDGPLQPRLLDTEGALWFTAAGVLGQVAVGDDGFRYRLLGQGIDWLDSEARALHQDATGTLWLSTYGQGLIRIRDGSLARVGRQQGLTELSLGGILEDHAERLWINSNRGVLVLPVARLNAAIDNADDTIVPRFLGSPETNGPAAARDASGRMWFPTVRGLLIADPLRLTSSLQPPQVHIEQVVTGDTIIATDPSVIVPAGSRDLTIKYTGIWLHHPDQVHFRYRLLGYNDNWIRAGPRRQAFFTKVPPGEYTFQVAAGTGGGAWTNLSLPVSVAAHIHQTTWFRTAGVLGLAVLLFALHRYRVRSVERHAQLLQSEIENRKKAERERARMELSLMQSSRLEAVGRLAGGIAHDFNNVLTAVLGHAEQAQAEAGDNTAVTGQVAGIIECGERAANLTRQLLAFSRQQVLHPQNICANRIIEALRPMLTQLLPDNIALTWQPEDALPDTRVDPSQLEQVVMNLVLNARDAMPDGGEIIIATRSVDHAGKPHTAEIPGRYIEISVTDSGAGMQPNVAARVFDPFFTTKGAGHGTGLGLASVHGIVLQSGGHIELDSAPSRGSVFRVYFPALESVSGGERADLVGQPPDRQDVGGSERLLICEDNDAIRPMLLRTLSASGYSVLEAAHPEQALALVDQGQEVDLLITDVILPGMNGRELATALRRHLPGIRVLYISGYTDEILDDTADDVGTAFLQKPFRPSELLNAVRQTLNRGRAPTTRRSA